MCLDWIDQGEITVGGKSLFVLLKKHKHSILGRLFKSKDWTLEQKMAVLDKHLTE